MQSITTSMHLSYIDNWRLAEALRYDSHVSHRQVAQVQDDDVQSDVSDF